MVPEGDEIYSLYVGRYLARGSKVEVLEEGWRPSAIIIAEFPDKFC